jgi:pseudouridine-5'-phosphate glycosidase
VVDVSAEFGWGGPFDVSPFVGAAIKNKRPVVALETTLVTHGLPHPEGVQAAARLEAEVVAAGAVPATIGVLDGRVRVGLSSEELERLATAPDTAKLNLSNMAAQVAAGRPGSTTVAATLAVAAWTGIGVFATGGIGGVHRGAEETGDISADLHALGRYDVAVVCAGAKAVLDLPRTVEMLETLGVPIYGYGTSEFPAFYRRSCGLPVDHRFDDLDLLARAIELHSDLGLSTGVVVANPIPSAYEMPLELYEGALATALAEAAERNVRGRAVTPFLLDRIRELTEGKSVFSNLALLAHNARVAGQLAVALSKSWAERRGEA